MSARFDVTLMAVGPKTLRQEKGISVVGLDSPGTIAGRLLNAKRILGELTSGNYALLHFHDPELLWVGFVAVILGHKVIYDIHEDIRGIAQIRPWVPSSLRSIVGVVGRWVELAGQKVFDGIVLAEQGYEKLFQSRPNTEVVQNFVRVSPAPVNRRESGGKRILYVGDVSEARGIGILLEAYAFLQAEDSTIGLDIVGRIEKSFEGKLHARIAKLPHPGRVFLPGYVSLDKLEGWIEGATVGVVPLRSSPNYNHSLPTKIFDYMNWGLAYVYTNIPLWVRTFGDSRGGLYFRDGDAKDLAQKLERLLIQEGLRREMKRDARQAASRFDWSTEERKLMGLYQRILLGTEISRHPSPW